MRLILMPVEGDVVMDELLTLKQAAEFLQIHEKSLLKLLAKEEVPARKIMGKWRFSRDAILQWIALGRSTDFAKSLTVEEDADDEV